MKQTIVLKISCGDEFTAQWSEYIPFDVESKEDFLLNLNLSLINFEESRPKMEAELQQIETEFWKYRSDTKNYQVDKVSALYDKKLKKEKEINTFFFDNRSFDMESFFERDLYSTAGGWKRIEFREQSVLTAEEWIMQQKERWP